MVLLCAPRRFVELGPPRQMLARPALLELPHCAALRGREREVVALRSDDGVQWSVHQGGASERGVLDALGDTFPGTSTFENPLAHAYKYTHTIHTCCKVDWKQSLFEE